jgi:hypothetical protein
VTRAALLFLLRVYQAFFSALMPSACKFYPSCSHYAVDAVTIHGARRGSWLAFRRVMRCHPFTRGGVDLVPEAFDFSPDFSKVETGPGDAADFAAPAARRTTGTMPALNTRSLSASGSTSRAARVDCGQAATKLNHSSFNRTSDNSTSNRTSEEAGT